MFYTCQNGPEVLTAYFSPEEESDNLGFHLTQHSGRFDCFCFFNKLYRSVPGLVPGDSIVHTALQNTWLLPEDSARKMAFMLIKT